MPRPCRSETGSTNQRLRGGYTGGYYLDIESGWGADKLLFFTCFTNLNEMKNACENSCSYIIGYFGAGRLCD